MKEQFSLRTVRKKIIMVSKIAGIALLLSYLVTTRLPLDQDISFLLWVVIVILLYFIKDYLLGSVI